MGLTPMEPVGYSGDRRLRYLDVGGYCTDRIHNPFARCGTLSDSSNTQYEDYATGDSSALSQML